MVDRCKERVRVPLLELLAGAVVPFYRNSYTSVYQGSSRALCGTKVG